MTIEIIKGQDNAVAAFFSATTQTPETDAAWDKYISYPYTYGAGDLRILAQRLERERDEARELHMNTLRERDKWEETARLYCQNSDYHQEMREKAERERDEARVELAALKQAIVKSRSSKTGWINCGGVEEGAK
jgi:hypothetical protein